MEGEVRIMVTDRSVEQFLGLEPSNVVVGTEQ